MVDTPPPIPPDSHSPPSRESEWPQAHWIGLLVALIALLLMILALLMSPKSELVSGNKDSGVASEQGTEDVDSSGVESGATEIQAGKNSTEVTVSLPSPALEEVATEEGASTEDIDAGTAEEVIAEPGGEDSKADESDAERERATDPAVTSDMPTEGPGAESHPKAGSRIRRLNVGSGLIPLAVGEGNPLRVGEEVGSIVYVIDKSGSMAGERFGQVSSSLLDAINALSESQKYAVVLFDTSAYPIGRPALIPASTKNTSETARALARVSADGGTAPFEAMKQALDLNPEAIVLLSDGDFNAFEVTQITQYNHSGPRVTTIHCVGLQRNISTLKQLANDNGNGAYTTVQLLQNP